MPTAWFQLPEQVVEQGDSEVRMPDFFGHDVHGFSSPRPEPGGPSRRLVHVGGTEAALDALASEPQAVRLDNLPVEALNNMFGQNRDTNGWERGFRVTDPVVGSEPIETEIE